MKTQPTDIDRKAAELFISARRMRVWIRGPIGDIPVTVVSDTRFNGDSQCVRDGGNGGVHSGALSESWHWIPWPPVAIDTDDPATVGCMLAQVEAAVGDGVPVEMHRISGRWWQTDAPGEGGPTRGAALVAAMRKLKGVKR
jgi:hypothetical protein